ncbi:hypothetical protein FNH05_29730 [Amycolatopsis rhizosphaerae]|uniref:ESX-1 secretion-associated protein n=1 Tax=Amycolatopsis rhizosphaerae TaxID=2053003 RepID=A0A558B0D5_9PSEU|nr:hypothetical protein [Amycolatopsis rhizosphaerae]TVT29970.1 hypothetical protein FNH05_29730 [Amycolatopsis rhizosphaerae]
MAPPESIKGIPGAMHQCASDLWEVVANTPIPSDLKGWSEVTCTVGLNGHEELVKAANDSTKKLYEFITQLNEAATALSTVAHDAATKYDSADLENKNALKDAFEQFTKDSFAKMTGDGLPPILPELDYHSDQ